MGVLDDLILEVRISLSIKSRTVKNQKHCMILAQLEYITVSVLHFIILQLLPY